MPEQTSPHNPCATCGACCRSYGVQVYGYDLWRIYAGLRMSPENYVIAYPQSPPGPDGFRLAPDGPLRALILDKRGALKPASPCVFLLTLADGQTRCGIYPYRPAVCRTYPMGLWSGAVFQRKETLCPPDSWPLPTVFRPTWRTAIHAFFRHMDIYHEVVARWNARVAAARPGTEFALTTYFAYLLNVYERLAALDESWGETATAGLDETWPTRPRQALEPAALAAHAEDWPWLRYLLAARRIIDAFYPGIPPQPLLVLGAGEAVPAPSVNVLDAAAAGTRPPAPRPEIGAPRPGI